MRTKPLVLVTSVLVSLVAASACSERFPREVVPTEAGVPPAPDAGLPSLEAEPPSQITFAKRRDASSSPVIFDAERGGVWTADGDLGTVSYVDVDKHVVVQSVAVGKDVRSIALSPDARFVAAVDRDGASVTLLDAESRAVLRAIPLGSHPRAAVWDAADPRWLYVAIEDDNAIAIVDRTRGVLLREVAVGRLPSGLAVSRQRAELYVTHRIDGRVTVVSLAGGYTPADQSAPLVEVAIGDEPATDDPKVPHGKPFAFESLAWGADGNIAWLPHELLAPTHPIEFQSTLFPAISVVDLAARAEVQNDPAGPAFAGRKNLFAAINLVDPTGNIDVISQPCAAALHPNGFVAYAIACASEDLLTFDVLSGAATDILRGLPGDHPVGLTLDDTGARAFIVADQSHTLSIADTGAGSVLAHVKLVGDPIVLGKDATDAESIAKREGLKLFFRANSSKGDVATTGNNWMSCGGCHLDGFVSTNLAFFEDALVVDPTKDAQIGHVGLADLFSTSPTPTDPKFNPHDILIAFTDQGGLAPDRTGAHRDNAIDPSAPSPASKAMAANVARIVARDLPVGPNWLLPGAEKPNADYDGQWCGNCHQAEFAAWQKSVHAHSAQDPMVQHGMKVEVDKRGPQYSRVCAGCHDPVSVRLGDTSMTSNRGITCLGCHDTERLIRAGGNGDLEMKSHDWTVSHADRAKAGLEKLRDPEFCGGCHQQFVPGTGLEALSTLREWQTSIYGNANAKVDGGVSDSKRCVDCHAQKNSDGVADHAMVGGNVYLTNLYGPGDMETAERGNLKIAIGLVAARQNGAVAVTVKNRGSGHSFPTGVTDIREPWVELQAIDAGGKLLARFGGPDAAGLIPANAARFGIDIATADGTVLLQHELSQSTRIPFDLRVPAAGSTVVTLALPATPPSATDHFEAVLYYRNVRTPYYRAAVNASTPDVHAPEVEVARTVVPKN